MPARRSLVSLLPLLATSACMMQQLGSGPRPSAIVLRVIAGDSSSRTGSLLVADGDSLILYDLEAKERFVVREDSAGVLEIYRGQQGGLKPVAKGAGKGALIGAGIGALVGVLTPVIFSGWGDVDAGKAVATGALVGAVEGAALGAQYGAVQGETVWERVTFRQLKQELCRCADPKKS